ncbi:MAG: hypothetical protein JXX14_07725 [Deltaproteobacteria bacterium]|nr:hypothetical protein [Deltaproteobacteria bacterium]
MWYLVFQNSPPAYVTSTDPGDVSTWSAIPQFMPNPTFLSDNGDADMDYWVICDDTNCYLFFTAFNGSLYRAQTPIGDFPSGFSEANTVEVMTDSQYALFTGTAVYNMQGTNTYLLLVAGFDGDGEYYRAWTSDALNGTWTDLASQQRQLVCISGQCNRPGMDFHRHLSGRNPAHQS